MTVTSRYAQETRRRLAALPEPARSSLPPRDNTKQLEAAREALQAIDGLDGDQLQEGVALAATIAPNDPELVASVVRELLAEGLEPSDDSFWREVTMRASFKRRSIL